MSIINNFRTFDSSSTNIYTIGEFTNLSEEVLNGFKNGDAIPSKTFNSILRQNSLFCKCFTDYMNDYVDTTTITNISHLSNEESITDFIENFFINKLKQINISINNITNTDTTSGKMLYTLNNTFTELQPPANDITSTNKYRVEYQTNDNNVIPYVRNVKLFESFNNKFTQKTSTLRVCNINLQKMLQTLSKTNVDNYKVMIDVIEAQQVDYLDIDIHYYFEFNLNKLYGLKSVTTSESSYTTIYDNSYNLQGFVIDSHVFKIGISDDMGTYVQSDYQYETPKYLTIINNDGIDSNKFTINITLKERI